MNKTPIYYHNGEHAREHGELEQYRATTKALRECRNDIEAIIKARFDGMHLDKVAVYEALTKYDAPLIALVLSATLLEREHDGRFNPASKGWAHTVKQLDPPSSGYVYRDYTLHTHSAVLDGFVIMFISAAY